MRIIPVLIFLLQVFSFAQIQKSVAVLPSDGNILKPIELERLTDKVRGAALNVLPASSFILLKQDVVIKRLGGAENYIKECRESSCIVDLGKKASVDYVAQASVSGWNEKLRLKVELFNVKTEGLMGIYDEVYENIDALISDIDVKIPNMFKKIPLQANGVFSTRDEHSKPQSVDSDGNKDKIAGDIETFTDSRDGKSYKFVKIGNHIWMAENLNYETGNSWCYENSDANCKIYGRLYSFNTALNACPSGWHLPDKEWDSLGQSVGAKKIPGEWHGAGKKLKSKSGWNEYEGTSGNGTDDYGFSALPGGVYSAGTFFGIGKYGVWWSVAAKGYISYRSMSYNYEFINLDPNYMFHGLYGFSVRCVKNQK